MTECRVDILSLDDAKETASRVDMISAFAELNVFRVTLQRPKTAKALSKLALRGDWRASQHFGADEMVLLDAVDTLLEEGTLSAEKMKACRERFGQKAAIELVTAVGCWQLVSKLARSLAIPLEEGIDSWPPDGRQPT